MRVYADNAATTYISETAMNTLVDCLKNYNSNPNSLHIDGQITAEKLAESREKVAKAINAANPNEIYFTSGGSEADNQALLSAARVLKDKGKKHLVSLNIEHHAILHTLKKLEKEGFEVTLLAPESNGIVDVNKVPFAKILRWYLSCLPIMRWVPFSRFRKSVPSARKRAFCSTPMRFRQRLTCQLMYRQ